MKTYFLLMALVALIYGFSLRDQSDLKKMPVKELEQHNIFIQGYLKSSVLEEITNLSGLIINNIIKSELELGSDFDFNFFLTKERQRLTLYGLNSFDIQASNSLLYPLIDSFFDQNKSILNLLEIALSPNIHLFGENRDELVILITDSKNQLGSLNKTLKNIFNQANSTFQSTYSQDLYNIAKSEQFDYIPHIGLGRIRVSSIKYYIKQTDQTSSILDRINQRILREILDMIKDHLARKDNRLKFDMLGITDLKLKSCVKEYIL